MSTLPHVSASTELTKDQKEEQTRWMKKVMDEWIKTDSPILRFPTSLPWPARQSVRSMANRLQLTWRDIIVDEETKTKRVEVGETPGNPQLHRIKFIQVSGFLHFIRSTSRAVSKTPVRRLLSL